MLLGGGEAGAPEQAAAEEAEPNLDLVEPGAMPGGVDEPDAVGSVLQASLAGSHVAQDAGRAFPAQVVRDAAPFGDPLDQPGGLVGVG